MPRKITIEVSDVVYNLLQVLTLTVLREHPPRSVEDVVSLLVDHAQQGVYRPGAWERQWLEQVFGDEWQQFLEPGDPYGRPNSPMFQRPARK